MSSFKTSLEDMRQAAVSMAKAYGFRKGWVTVNHDGLIVGFVRRPMYSSLNMWWYSNVTNSIEIGEINADLDFYNDCCWRIENETREN